MRRWIQCFPIRTALRSDPLFGRYVWLSNTSSAISAPKTDPPAPPRHAPGTPRTPWRQKRIVFLIKRNAFERIWRSRRQMTLPDPSAAAAADRRHRPPPPPAAAVRRRRRPPPPPPAAAVRRRRRRPPPATAATAVRRRPPPPAAAARPSLYIQTPDRPPQRLLLVYILHNIFLFIKNPDAQT